ncbi:putative malate dehydrogenase 1B [Saccoglossus kowalevskii]|uniref:Malate dehydrogenase, cytoplasmic n=1 Tax=Saccoglossus kowalevskii TaxID=10224 RepID=A0ABM0GZ83_SACKO|nr:PREDICTED: putative malate dehydrogenase 1B-like [Saccoglossus kowalevskii]
MSKFVVAGSADCPYYAKAELLADDLKTNLPDFKIHKIVKNPDEWKNWLEETCSKHGWMHNKSPIVWRELVDRGGKGVLIGGANEFQEYALGYYGVKSKMVSDDMKKVSTENLETKIIVTAEEEYKKSLSKPLHVCITDAASSAAYYMVHAIARGDVFGKDTEVSLRLLSEDSGVTDELEGVKMEAVDLACPLLKDVRVETDIKQAFTNVGVVIMIDEIEKKEDMDSKDWLKKNADFFKSRGTVLDEVASGDVKVVVAGHGPVNFNTYILSHSAPSIPRQNFVAQARLRENYAKAVVAKKLAVNSAGIVDLIVWGNANGTTYTDVTRSRVHGYDGAIWGPPTFNRPVMEMVHDNKWLETEFLDLVKARKETVEGTLGHNTSMSNAAAITTLLHDWWNGSPPGRIYSLGVVSDGWYYDLPEGIVFSLPVKFQKGIWEVVQDLELDENVKSKLQEISLELKKELHVMFPPPFTSTPPPSEEESENDDEKLKKVFGQDGETDEIVPSDGEAKTEEELNAERQLGTIKEEVEPEITDAEKSLIATTDTEQPSSTEPPPPPASQTE